jgi:hypothetical protein
MRECWSVLALGSAPICHEDMLLFRPLQQKASPKLSFVIDSHGQKLCPADRMESKTRVRVAALDVSEIRHQDVVVASIFRTMHSGDSMMFWSRNDISAPFNSLCCGLTERLGIVCLRRCGGLFMGNQCAHWWILDAAVEQFSGLSPSLTNLGTLQISPTSHSDHSLLSKALCHHPRVMHRESNLLFHVR